MMSKNARKILLSAKDSFYIIFLKYFDYLFRAKGIHRSWVPFVMHKRR